MDEIRKYGELDRFVRGVDHVDIKTIEGEVNLRQFISGMLSYSPWWIVFLVRVREVLVKALGLVKHEKPDFLPSVRPEDLSFTSGDQAFLFMVRAAEEDAYWVSETPKDRHLAAFFGVVAEPVSDRSTRFHVFTAVRYLHWTGPVYFNLIRPFHHLVVSSMMRHGIRQQESHRK